MEYLKVWTSFRELLEPLTDAERGRLFVAMLEYAESGAEPQLSGSERYVWPAARQSINNTRDRTEQMRANGSKPKQTGANESKPEQPGAKPSRPFDKEKEKEKDNYTPPRSARAREDTPLGPVDLDPLILKLQQELNGMTDNHYQALNDYREQLGDDLVSHAVDEAVGNGVRNWTYVEKILARYLKEGIRDLGEAKASDERRKQDAPQQKPRLLRAQDYEQREYVEDEMKKILDVHALYR